MRSAKSARSKSILFAATLSLCVGGISSAVKVTWDAGANTTWDTTSNNWNGAPWNNSAYNTAIFDTSGIGAVDVSGTINANAVSFGWDGYVLNGSGTLNLGPATTSGGLANGVISVGTLSTVPINIAVNSTVGLTKAGPGTLLLNTAPALTGKVSVIGNYQTDIFVGDPFSSDPGGMLTLANASILPSTVAVGIGNGFLNIGNANTTIGSVIFSNITIGSQWNAGLNANNGIVGSGTLKVTNDILVVGKNFGGGNAGNTIATPFDLDGKTQYIRIGGGGSIAAFGNSLMLTGVVSNGSIYKTLGPGPNGIPLSRADGISLLANNSYTGPTILNGGTTYATGTNASTSAKVHAGALLLCGTDGSFANSPDMELVGGGLILDNNWQYGYTIVSGVETPLTGFPPINRGNNSDRVPDTGHVDMNTGSIQLIGTPGGNSTETVGTLNVLSGLNNFNVYPQNAGAATLTAANLLMSSRATLLVNTSTNALVGSLSTTNSSNLLGGNAKMMISGSIPAADATGILPRVVTNFDFVKYDATTGITPLSAGSYTNNLTTPNVNVAMTAAGTVSSSIAINALKMAGTTAAVNTIAISSGQALTINSGMVIGGNTNAGTISGAGTLAFGSNPGIFMMSGNTTVSAAISGTEGLIQSALTNNTLTLSGDLSGLSGKMAVYSGTINLNTNSFSGPIDVRAGVLSLGVSQTGSGLGDITLGNPANDADMVGLNQTLSLSAAGAGATFDRNLVVDNKTTTIGGQAFGSAFSFASQLSPLSNSSGTQTFNGNITLNSHLNLQGGGAGNNTGATVFTGTISGPGIFFIPNGRVIFSPTSHLDNTGGLYIGNSGNSMQMSFLGASASSEAITLNGGNSNTVSYQGAGAMPTGPITVQNAQGTTAPTIIPLSTSTLPNHFILNGDLIASPGAGVAATWNGNISGAGSFTKSGAGTLILNGTNTITGPTNITAGTLALTGSATVPSASFLINGGALNVAGKSSTYSTSPGQTITTGASGASIVGNFIHDEGTLSVGGDTSVGTLNATGAFDITGGSIVYSTTASLAAADLINVTGTTAASGSASITLNTVNGVANGAYTLLTASGGVTGSVAGWTVDNSPLSPGSTAGVEIVGNSIVLNLGLTPRSGLSWAGTGGGTWDVATSSNWYNPGLPGADKFYLADAVTFGDTYDGVNAPVTTSITLNSLVVPSSVTVNSSLDYSISGTGTISGAIPLTKSGTGVLTMTNNNTYTGGTTINGGTITIGSSGTILLTAIGSGTLTLNGGALAGTSAGLNGSTGTLSTPIQVNAPGGTINFTSPATAEGTLNLAGSLTGTGSLHLMSTGTEHFNVRGVNTAFNGSMVVDGSNAILRFITPASASATTAYELNSGTLCVDVGTLSQTISLGSLKGAAGTTLRGHWSFNTGAAHTLEIGALNTSTEFAGNVIDGRQGNTSGTFRATSIKKVGSGTLTLSGTNTYTGTTTVAGGTLVLGANAQAPVLTGGGAILNGGVLAMNYTGTSPQAVIVADLVANATTGFQAGKVRTSIPVDNAKAIGWLDNGSTFLARYTHKGDIDLDGAVTSTDFNNFVAAFGMTSGAIWGQGDFDYNGKVNTNDFNYIAGNFGAAAITAPLPAPSLGAVVPEPASIGLLGLVGLLMRRRGSR